ncbi:MAG: DUF5777 family beta-barrel protein [Bacteroidia bacterium]|jgi:hypothetical protein|nr:DUF5777 family beta-barrel protein [Bacteroidia bacterium]
MVSLKLNILAVVVLTAFTLQSQDEDLLSLIAENDQGPKKVYATFKTMRIANAQTIETVKKKHLDFRILHRFGNIYDATVPNPINNTFQTFFGFDQVTDIRFSFDYGLTDKLCIGIGRSKMNKLFDGNFKWRFLEQTSDFKIPVSMALFESVGYSFAPTNELYSGVQKDFETDERHRFSYCTQLIIASKVTDWLSLELLPTYMYRNFIKESYNTNSSEADVNGFFSLGFGGRLKLSKRFSIIGDYFFNFSPYYINNPSVTLPLALGFEVETGGHVFSLLFTNASGIIENNFLPYTTDSWTDGQIKFGFCISRTFAL